VLAWLACWACLACSGRLIPLLDNLHDWFNYETSSFL
jgi:hypothetical protein